jgi:hypothetical protein
MNTTPLDSTAELTVRAPSLKELFSDRDFDPFFDDAGTLASIPQIARFPNYVSRLTRGRLRVILPAVEVSQHTQSRVEAAIASYCAHKLAELGAQMDEWRHEAWGAFLWGLGFFALSLMVTAGIEHAKLLPDAIRTLAIETLVIAGWVIMWQPMDTLILGWLPIRKQEQTFRALASMGASVEPAPEI